MSDKIWQGPLPQIEDDKNLSPTVRQGLKGPHLAVMLGPNEWLPIVPGMIVALVKDRSQIDGVAPYILTKCNWKPGKEEIELVSVGKEGSERRVLKLGSRYFGHASKENDELDENLNKKGDKQ